jgi:Phosphotransferase enzyme family
MDCKTAKLKIEKCGYSIDSIKLIPEGSNHNIFDVKLFNDQNVIARFKKGKNGEIKRDSLYGGVTSIERECAIYNILTDAVLPAPRVLEKHVDFLLVEKLPGMLWREYMEVNDFQKDNFLISMYELGKVIAKVQQITFTANGDIMSDNQIYPQYFSNFIDRFSAVMQMRIFHAAQKKVFSKAEIRLLKKKFISNCIALRAKLSEKAVPVMVLTDLHADNFLVDESGNPSGFFDLESCQAAHPALEFYGLKFFLFNYFDKVAFMEAEDSFFAGYCNANGKYEQEDPVNKQLEKLLTAGRLLELAESYYNVKDGLRDSWSDRFKTLLKNYINRNRIDYMGISEIYRSKTKQPRFCK